MYVYMYVLYCTHIDNVLRTQVSPVRMGICMYVMNMHVMYCTHVAKFLQREWVYVCSVYMYVV